MDDFDFLDDLIKNEEAADEDALVGYQVDDEDEDEGVSPGETPDISPDMSPGATPPEYGTSFRDRERLGMPGERLGAAAKTKLERMIRAQTVSKEDLFMDQVQQDLQQYNLESYSELVTKIPKYWFKNSAALAAAIYSMHRLAGKEMSAKKLNTYAKHTSIRKEDLLRYYLLVKHYVKEL